MKETERRIMEYNKILPGLRAKLSAAAMMFVIAIIMMTSATFAWLTISRNPEVKGIETTVTANGNLEIALSDADGLTPDASAIGDGDAERKTLVERNLTWGNLVNLSDEAYGLQELTLQPATLNTSDLLNSPLYGAMYGDDGRVTNIGGDFAYGIYQITNAEEGKGAFVVPETMQYGVRAISSVTYDDLTGDAEYRKLLEEATTALTNTQKDYRAIVSNDNYMNSLSGLVGKYVQAKIDDTELIDCSYYMEDLYEMYEKFSACLDTAAYATLQYANMQQILLIPAQHRQLFSSVEELFAAELVKDKDGDYIIIKTESGTSYKIVLTSLAQLKDDIEKMKDYLQQIKTFSERGEGVPVYWSEVKPAVDFVADTNEATINGTKISGLTTDYILNNALSLAFGTSNVVITEGAIKDMEQRIGTMLKDVNKTLSIRVDGSSISSLLSNVSLKAKVSTNAIAPFSLEQDFQYTKSLFTGKFEGNTPIAADTYGLAVDFWVRTNATDSILILEGEVDSTKVHRTDKDGNYYYEDNEGRHYIYVVSEEKYYDSYGSEVTDEELIDSLTALEDRYVSGYEGENRIWKDGILQENSTTQGMGSCYVFYADTPEDQQQALTLLKEMKIEFIDEEGGRLASAGLDTDHAYEEGGRVTVPIVITNSNLEAGRDDEGELYYGIIELHKSEPVRITALMYLDGADLTNDHVLAAADIEGRLNIQFGVNTELNSIDDKKLSSETIELSAKFLSNGMESTSLEFNYDNNNAAAATVALNIGGVLPEKVTASFSRLINQTQGSRIKPELLFAKSDEKWVTNAQFAFPGNYILRTVWLDGIEYELDTPLTVKVNGFDITSVICSLCNGSNEAVIITDESSKTVPVTISFGSSAYEPTKVQAVWFDDETGQQTLIPLSSDKNGVWSGSGTIFSSGSYELTSLFVDGEYVGIPDNMQKKLTLYLGMKTEVRLSETSIVYDGQSKPVVSVYTRIYDNAGTEIKGMNNPWLEYSLTSSTTTKLSSVLKWNEEARFYVGEFKIEKPGIYQFSKLIIGADGSENTIGVAQSAENLIVYTPNQAEFLGASAENYQFAPDRDAYITFETENANAASKAKVVFENIETGEIREAEQVWGNSGTETLDTDELFTRIDVSETKTQWKAKIPTTEIAINQEGTWKVQSISLAGIFYDGHWNDDYVTWDVSEDAITTKVVNYVHVKANNVSDTAKPTLLTGEFMTEHKKSNIMSLTIADYEDEAIPNVDNVTVTYELIPSSTSKYGYSTNSLGTNRGEENPSTTFSVDNGMYVQGDALNFKYAGDYQAKITMDITTARGAYTYTSGTNDSADTFVLPTNMPQYAVKWTTPVVTINSVVMYNESRTDYTSGTVWENPQVDAGKDNSRDQNVVTKSCLVENTDSYSKATLYNHAIRCEERSGCLNTLDYYYIMFDDSTPSVTLSLSNIGENASDVKMVFEGKEDNTSMAQTRTFTFSSFENGSSISDAQSFGKVAGSTESSGTRYSQRYIFGESTQNTINVAYKGNIFKVDVAVPVTIYNPY